MMPTVFKAKREAKRSSSFHKTKIQNELQLNTLHLLKNSFDDYTERQSWEITKYKYFVSAFYELHDIHIF